MFIFSIKFHVHYSPAFISMFEVAARRFHLPFTSITRRFVIYIPSFIQSIHHLYGSLFTYIHLHSYLIPFEQCDCWIIVPFSNVKLRSYLSLLKLTMTLINCLISVLFHRTIYFTVTSVKNDQRQKITFREIWIIEIWNFRCSYVLKELLLESNICGKSVIYQ